MKKIILFICLFCSIGAQAGFWKAMWGQAPESAITFAPVGYHIMDGLRGTPQPNDLNWMTAINYKTYIIGTFNNSERRQTYFAGVDRDFYFHKRISLGYLLAIMHGYGGSLRPALGPVLGGDPGLLLALTARYRLTQHFDAFTAYYGMGFLFGVRYRF